MGRGSRKRWIWRVLLLLAVALALLWWRAHLDSEGVSYRPSTEPFVDATSWQVSSLREFTPGLPEEVRELGRVAWEGRAERIAFDAKDSDDAKFDVYLASPDGGEAECLSCDVPWLAGRNVGNPAYDPEGRWLLMQIENAEPIHGDLELSPLIADASYPGFGLSSSLWVYDLEQGQFHLLYEVEGENAIGTLHPHFSKDGNRVTWTRVVGNDGCMGDMGVMVADFVATPLPHLENVRSIRADLAPGQRFFETQDYREGEILVACAPQPGQPHHFMDLCRLDAETGDLRRLTRRSGAEGESGSWEEHAKFLDESSILFVSSLGYPSPVETCDMKNASFMKWLKTDLYVQDMGRPGTTAERLTFWNEPGHPMYCDCGNALASDFSWNEGRSTAVLFVQYLDWPRYLPIPIGFDARHYLVELERAPDS